MYMLTKKQKAQIRQFASEAHDRELTDALTTLYEEFQLWGGDQISAFELQEKIHIFHDGISRDLYKRYVMGNLELAVVYALNHGVLNQDEVGEDIAKALGVAPE